MKNIIEYIQANQNKQHKWYLYNRIEVNVDDHINDVRFFKEVCEKIENLLPVKLFSEIKEINFILLPEMEQRKIDSFFHNNKIYINPFYETKNIEIVARDIIHEVGHSLEKKYYSFIFKDQMLKNEFASKRNYLFSIFKNFDLDPPSDLVYTLNYSRIVDQYIYSIEDKIEVDNNLFIDLYSSISIQEYWASSFEEYFFNSNRVFVVSKLLFNKIKSIIEEI